MLLLCMVVSVHAQHDFLTKGMASFYHDNFEGRRTASGEIFKQSKMTCAHRSLPFGTQLLVTNLENGKTAVLTVNDRGPYANYRIIDVTKSAAKKLDFIKQGETKVLLELHLPDNLKDSLIYLNDTVNFFYRVIRQDSAQTMFSIKIGAYTNEQKFYEMVNQVEAELYREVYIQTVSYNRGMLYRLYTGCFGTRENAEDYLRQIKSYYPDSYVVEVK